MYKKIPYEEAIKNVHDVIPYHWLNRNLTVVAQGVIGLKYIHIVSEPDYNGEETESGVIIYSKRGDNVPESTL